MDELPCPCRARTPSVIRSWKLRRYRHGPCRAKLPSPCGSWKSPLIAYRVGSPALSGWDLEQVLTSARSPPYQYKKLIAFTTAGLPSGGHACHCSTPRFRRNCWAAVSGRTRSGQGRRRSHPTRKVRPKSSSRTRTLWRHREGAQSGRSSLLLSTNRTMSR
jgi:hypothetical protein